MISQEMVNETKEQTLNHICKVRKNIAILINLIRKSKLKKEISKEFIKRLKDRSRYHDKSKLESPEFDYFCLHTHKLKNLTYGSSDYNKCLEEMKPGIHHHYEFNRHHPEYHINGLKDMGIIDILEMIADWKAATQRHLDGDINRSIEINSVRFNMCNQLKQILLNTVEVFNYKENEDLNLVSLIKFIYSNDLNSIYLEGQLKQIVLNTLKIIGKK